MPPFDAMSVLPRPARPTISCVVPAYNEADNLHLLLTGLTAQLATLTEQWEIVVVDDGSRDATPAEMARWAQRAGLRYVRLSRNFGKEAALTAGIDHARGQVVVLMDADMQHPATLIPDMLLAWQRGADMVCAARASRSDESWIKRVGTRVFYALVNSNTAVQIPVDAGDFRLMDRCVVDALRSLPERNRFMKGLYAWVGFRTEIVPYTPAQRHAGRTTFSTSRLAKLAFTGVTAFTNLPLRLWSAIGAVIAFLSLGFACYIAIQYLIYGNNVPGWATITTGMALFSGVQLLSIGILGEYVGRIFDEVKQRPIYVVGQELGSSRIGAEPIVGEGAEALAADAIDSRLMRTLMVCADDFGMAPGVSRGIARLALGGRLDAVSCVTTGPGWPQQAVLLRELPAAVQRGLHINLTEGEPLSAALRAHWPRFPSLGRLLLLSQARRLPAAALADELAAQTAAFIDATGAPPDHLDGHQHVHGFPVVRRAVLALQRRCRSRLRSAALPGWLGRTGAGSVG